VNNLLRTEKRDLVLLFILLLSSGNLLIVASFGNFSSIFCIAISSFFIDWKRLIESSSRLSRKFYFYILFIFLISLFQKLLLGSVSYLGILNFCLKIVYGGLIINYLGRNFPMYFFKLIYWLSVIAIIGFAFFQFFKFPPSFFLSVNKGEFSVLIYGYTQQQFSRLSGMFWEPGAYGGVITLMLAFNFNRFTLILRQYRFEFIIIMINIVLTFSTSTYLATFVLFIIYFTIIKVSIVKRIFFASLFILIFFQIYTKLEFLDSKVSSQYTDAQEQKIGDFSNSRFGSFLFDLHYILKHPIIGNGMQEETRYMDHLYYVRQKLTNSTANSFSNGIATWGLPFVIFYLLSILKSRRMDANSLVIFIVAILNLQSEPWLNYPLYLGLGI
jgi:hypothetical protein